MGSVYSWFKINFCSKTLNFTDLKSGKSCLRILTHFFIVFAVLPDVNPSWITDWITFIGLQYPQEPWSGEMTLFYCSNRRATFLHIKLVEKKSRGRNASGYQHSGKLWYKPKYPGGSSSTILHPWTEVRGHKFCSNKQ